MYLLGRTQMIPAASYEDHLVPYEGDMDLTERHRLMCINMTMRRLRKRAWSI